MIKKYIRGNAERGAEVIAELEKLGGKNAKNLSGRNRKNLYFISKKGEIEQVQRNSMQGEIIQETFEKINLKQIEETREGYRSGIKVFAKLMDKEATEFDLFVGERICKDLLKKLSSIRKKCATHPLLKIKCSPSMVIGVGLYLVREKKESYKKVQEFFLTLMDNSFASDLLKRVYEESIGSKHTFWSDENCKEVVNVYYKTNEPKFDPSTLKPFDKVLICDSIGPEDADPNKKWRCDFFGFIADGEQYPYKCVGGQYEMCIPFNEETAHLLGTCERPPKFYDIFD